MSKDLEKEYRALVNSEAPDLWARIEVGLEEKTVRSHREKFIKKKWHFKMWAGLAAACVCVALSLPVIMRYFSPDGSNSDIVSPGNNTVGMGDTAGITEYAAVESAGEIVLEESIRPAAINEEYDIAEAAEQKSNNFTVTAEILDIDIHKDSGILYTISVTASENTDVQAGSEIKIFSSALTTGGVIALEKSQSYQFTLADDMTHSAEEGVVYTLQAVENQ